MAGWVRAALGPKERGGGWGLRSEQGASGSGICVSSTDRAGRARVWPASQGAVRGWVLRSQEVRGGIQPERQGGQEQ